MRRYLIQLVILGASILPIAGCTEAPTAPSSNPIAAHANQAMPPGLTLRDFGATNIVGFLMVSRAELRDSLAADTLPRTIVRGYVGDSPGEEVSRHLRAEAIDVGRSAATGNYIDTLPDGSLREGSMIHWDLMMKNGAGLADSILLPESPAIGTIAPYQRISASQPLSAGIAGHLGGAPLLVMFRFDSSRTAQLLGDGVPVQRWEDSASLQIRAYDTGDLTVGTGVLRSLPAPGVYTLTLFRFIYREANRSDGRPVGLFAQSSHSIPIVIQP